MPHERPGREVTRVELQRPLEVLHGLLVHRPERVVVADDAAGLRAVLVDLGDNSIGVQKNS